MRVRRERERSEGREVSSESGKEKIEKRNEKREIRVRKRQREEAALACPFFLSSLTSHSSSLSTYPLGGAIDVAKQ
jgi:hypothetical protein